MSVSAERRPRVVVIMPARNSAKTLEDTFRAIPAGVADRVILVDNASKDDTVAIAGRDTGRVAGARAGLWRERKTVHVEPDEGR